jgi:hypothetical protein
MEFRYAIADGQPITRDSEEAIGTGARVTASYPQHDFGV